MDAIARLRSEMGEAAAVARGRHLERGCHSTVALHVAPDACRGAPHQRVQRALVQLAAAAGEANTRIDKRGGVTARTGRAWRKRFEESDLGELRTVHDGRGRKPSIPPENVQAIVHATLHEKPEGETYSSCWSMAKAQGVPPTTVQRISSAREIKPHRLKTVKLSNDKRFEEKLSDAVGLYLNPPENAIVLCMGDKSQIQTLDRIQTSVPMKPGQAGTMTRLRSKRDHHVVRGAGRADRVGDRAAPPAPGHSEFLKFLRTIDKEVPTGLQIHLILDNYATQSTRPRKGSSRSIPAPIWTSPRPQARDATSPSASGS